VGDSLSPPSMYVYHDLYTNDVLSIGNASSNSPLFSVCELVGEVVILDEAVRRDWMSRGSDIIFR
jgi:hypothetical protein